GAEPAMDLTVDIVGTYNGPFMSMGGGGGSTSLDPIRAEVTRVSDTEASIRLTEPSFGFLTPVTIPVTMTSRTAFTAGGGTIDGVEVSGGTGTLTGNTLTMTFTNSNGDSVTYTGTK
ncbi:MAG: hypothetical protein AAF544_13030, partial [Bacteroidota bacterium]